jgi:hypothetical protein
MIFFFKQLLPILSVRSLLIKILFLQIRDQSLPTGSDFSISDPSGINEHPNGQIAGRYLCQVLLARLLIFKRFIEIASKHGLLKNAQHCRKRWVLLQAYPHLLQRLTREGDPSYNDVFSALLSVIKDEDILSKTTASLQKVAFSLKNLRGQFWRLITFIDTTLSRYPTRPNESFCIVIDEAQSAAEEFPNAFFSRSEVPQRRPLLREIVAEWGLQYAHHSHSIVVSGTGIQLQIIEGATKSVMLKGNSKPVTFGGLTGNDSLDQLKAYFNFYIPKVLIKDSPGWNHLISRCSYWLRGRWVIYLEFHAHSH